MQILWLWKFQGLHRQNFLDLPSLYWHLYLKLWRYLLLIRNFQWAPQAEMFPTNRWTSHQTFHIHHQGHNLSQPLILVLHRIQLLHHQFTVLYNLQYSSHQIHRRHHYMFHPNPPRSKILPLHRRSQNPQLWLICTHQHYFRMNHQVL